MRTKRTKLLILLTTLATAETALASTGGGSGLLEAIIHLFGFCTC